MARRLINVERRSSLEGVSVLGQDMLSFTSITLRARSVSSRLLGSSYLDNKLDLNGDIIRQFTNSDRSAGMLSSLSEDLNEKI